MDAKFFQQIFVFAAIFMLLLIGMDWVRGVPVTGVTLLSAAGSALIATAIYAVVTLWLNKRKKRGD